EGEHSRVLPDRDRDRVPLELTEVRLTVVDEHVPDRLARTLLDVMIGVSTGHAEPLGQLTHHRGLARSRRADQHDPRADVSEGARRGVRGGRTISHPATVPVSAEA